MLFLDVTCTVPESLQKNEDYGLYNVLDMDCMIVFTLFRQDRKIQINGAYEKRSLDHDRIHAFVEQHYDGIIHGETYSNYLWDGYYYHITSWKEATPFIAFTLTVKEGAPFPEKDLRWLDVYERLNYRRSLVENEALQASHFNNTLFDSVQFAILALDREGHILRQNSVACDYFHQENGQRFSIEDKEQDLSFQRMFFLAVRRNMAQQDSGFVYGGKDQFRIFSLNITPLPDSKDRISGAVVTAIDVTKQRMLQTEVEQLKRYGFLGEFSMGLAHDIKNPLMIIQGCTKQLPQELLSLKNIISHQASRINDVITQFLSMGNFSDAAPALPLDLNQVLSDTVALVGKYHLNKHIQFHQELASPLPLFRAKELHIQQIFSNLLLNAIDAIPTSGEIFLSTAVEANSFIIRIRDTGIGIKPEELSQIFTPYYTTKRNGTGMGLFITRQLVQQYRGTIEFEPAEDRGTICTVTFPTVEAASIC